MLLDNVSDLTLLSSNMFLGRLDEYIFFLFAIVIFLIDGNGFKTSTMRLGADVIVFSRCSGKNGNRFVVYLC